MPGSGSTESTIWPLRARPPSRKPTPEDRSAGTQPASYSSPVQRVSDGLDGFIDRLPAVVDQHIVDLGPISPASCTLSIAAKGATPGESGPRPTWLPSDS